LYCPLSVRRPEQPIACAGFSADGKKPPYEGTQPIVAADPGIPPGCLPHAIGPERLHFAFDMTAPWPSSWQGSTNIKCAADGEFRAVVTVDGRPYGIHVKNFETIMARWQELWPEFRRVVSELMASYRRPVPQWTDVSCIYINSPSEPIIEGAGWSIGVVFSGDSTLWSLPYQGWTACPKQAQAIY
jgi:hypothetical protein